MKLATKSIIAVVEPDPYYWGDHDSNYQTSTYVAPR